MFNILFAKSKNKIAAKKQQLRMQAFLAVRDNPIRPTGCYGWILKIGGSPFTR